MGHPRAQISPPHALEHHLIHLLALTAREISAARLDKTFHVEFGLPTNSTVDKCADLGVFLESQVDLFCRGFRGQFLDDQGVKLGVLGFLEPMVFEQALEQRVEVAVVLPALDVEDRDTDCEWAVRQDKISHLFSRADELAFAAEAGFELATKGLEQMDVLGFLASKLQKRAHPAVAAGKAGPQTIEHVRKNEFFH